MSPRQEDQHGERYPVPEGISCVEMFYDDLDNKELSKDSDEIKCT